MTTLKLTIKKRFFDMILSGEKTEEYREMKPFWVKRLAVDGTVNLDTRTIRFNEFRQFDQIQFFNGASYSPTFPNFTIKCNGIHVGTGHTAWGAEEGVTYFILLLGEVIQTSIKKGWDPAQVKTSSVIEKENSLWDRYFNIHNTANN